MTLIYLSIFVGGFIAGSFFERHRTKAIVEELFQLFKKEELKKIQTIDIDPE